MTIKKRLFISNILMIIIPALLAVVLLTGCLFFFIVSAFPQAEYRLGIPGELAELRQKAVDLTQNWADEHDPACKSRLETEMSQLFEENQMKIQVKDGETVILQLGIETETVQKQLEQSLAVLNGKGMVSDGCFDLFGTQISANGKDYQVNLYNPVVAISHENIKVWAVGAVFFIIIILSFAIFLTNRFLTRFVFRRISEPLHTLTEGVRQIRDGNLTHRICYTEPDEFRPVCEDFNDMAERLRASVLQSQRQEESRKELLASISHDIRSPLTSIRAYVEGLLDGVADTPEKQTAYLSVVQRKTLEIDQMVRKLFLFSKMDMGEYPYNPEEIDAAKETADFVSASSEEYYSKGLQIKIASMPPKVLLEADPIYFRSILMNLLDNSAKYKKKAIGTVSITGTIFKNDFLLYVDDDGPGVPAEALPKLFDVFYRNDPSRKSPNQGSGLGLAIVAKTVERMGGAVCAENLPDGGLRIAIKIPLTERGQKK